MKLNVNSNDSSTTDGPVKIQWTVPMRLKDQEKIEAQIDQWVKEVINGWDELEKSIANADKQFKDDRIGHFPRSGYLRQDPRTGLYGHRFTELYTRYDDPTRKLFAYAVPKPEYRYLTRLGPNGGEYPVDRRQCSIGPDDASGDSAEECLERPESDGGTD